MKSHIDITKRIQVIWWGEKPRFAIWKYPREENDRMPHLFTGIVFGLFEIRIWRKRNTQGEISCNCGNIKGRHIEQDTCH